MRSDELIRSQYEHLLAQAAQMDRAAQINLLLDLAAQLRRQPEAKPDIQAWEGLFKGLCQDREENEYWVEREREMAESRVSWEKPGS